MGRGRDARHEVQDLRARPVGRRDAAAARMEERPRRGGHEAVGVEEILLQPFRREAPLQVAAR
jgi:hypothetical protein